MARLHPLLWVPRICICCKADTEWRGPCSLGTEAKTRPTIDIPAPPTPQACTPTGQGICPIPVPNLPSSCCHCCLIPSFPALLNPLHPVSPNILPDLACPNESVDLCKKALSSPLVLLQHATLCTTGAPFRTALCHLLAAEHIFCCWLAPIGFSCRLYLRCLLLT